MNFTDFVQYVKTQCMYETIYEDSEDRLMLVICMLDAYAMANKLSEKRWPSAAIGKETLQDAIERERAVGYREGHQNALKQMAQPEQEPVAWIDFQKEAQQIVESKVLWKRFIDGTPLANDIACWMADFAQYHTTPPQHKPLTDEEVEKIIKANISLQMNLAGIRQDFEAAHGIKGEA